MQPSAIVSKFTMQSVVRVGHFKTVRARDAGVDGKSINLNYINYLAGIVRAGDELPFGVCVS